MTVWRVVVAYVSGDGRTMEMWSRLLTRDRALTLRTKMRVRGLKAEALNTSWDKRNRDVYVDGPWCREWT